MKGIKRIGRYGPRCSRRAKDRYVEMLAEDYTSSFIPKLFLTELRERELAWIRGWKAQA